MRLLPARLTLALGFAALLLFSPVSSLAADGAALYSANCAKCHGPDGRAETPVGKAMKVRTLVSPEWAAADSADALIAAFQKNPKHKAMASKMNEAMLRAIAVHIRTLASSE